MSDVPQITEDRVPAIELRGVGKRFGTHWVFAGLDLAVRPREVVALFGGNGAGKSTLLKLLSTLLVPSAGVLRVCGFDARREARDIRQRVRVLAHDRQLYGILTVEENLRLAATISGIPAPDAALATALDRLQLTSRRTWRVARLSEGWKKRVMLARLHLVAGPAEVLLLDEPQPTLDAEGRAILSGLLNEWRTQGKTLIVASHDHDDTLRHVDRLVVLGAGGLTYDGPPRPVDGLL